jgi:hypothetical protein
MQIGREKPFKGRALGSYALFPGKVDLDAQQVAQGSSQNRNPKESLRHLAGNIAQEFFRTEKKVG